MIICSWWLGILNLRFNVFSAADDVLIKILESYRPQIPLVSSKKAFGKILCRLRKLVLMENSTPQRLCQYKELCEKHEMPNKNLLITDVPMRWNSTYDMILISWEKRKVLNAMTTTCHKDGR